MRWDGATYVDGSLPFGLHLAPKLFTAMADALLLILGQHGVRNAMHYLDDFLLVGRAGSEECGQALATSLQFCERLGVPIAPHKTEVPSSVISFLGIRIDTANMVLHLPQASPDLKLIVAAASIQTNTVCIYIHLTSPFPFTGFRFLGRSLGNLEVCAASYPSLFVLRP